MRRGRLLRVIGTLAAALLAVSGLRLAGGSPPSPEPAVILVVVDGLEPESISPTLAPNLWGLVEDEEARRWTNATGVMISETNPNHTAMITGTYPDVSGLVGNRFFNTKIRAREQMERPSLILAPTLFDAIEGQKPQLRTASILGKEKLRRLFDCTRTANGDCGVSNDNPELTPVIHALPDFVGGASAGFDPDAMEHDAVAEPVSGSGYSLDNEIMDIVIARHTGPAQPHFTFVNLSLVDGYQHLFGSRSPEGRGAVVNADANIGRLVSALQDAGRWDSTILIVTADHSFQDTGNPAGTDDVHVANPVTPHATGSLVVLSEVLGSCSNGTPFFAVGNGGSASIYIMDTDYDPYASMPLTVEQKACLAELRARALANPGVDDALYRLPVEDDATLISDAHPEWRLGTPRLGELLLTAKDDASFTESRASTFAVLAGNHGGPTAVPVPFIVASGSPRLVAGTDETNPVRHIDIAPTIAWLLGVTPPAASEGDVLCEAFTGCP